ncbi:MAG: AraC family transcriptional regulator [Synergistaceae bacterium]|jgi:AraC-like DNA-binding protein|nr:AraC family transcriptional regulator [Synergistaceae bacterium]
MNCRTFCIGDDFRYEEAIGDDGVFNKFYEIVNPGSKSLIAIPDGCIDIQFAYRNGICKAFLAGSLSKGRETVTGTYDRCFGIKLNAGLAPEHLTQSVGNIVDKRVPLSDHTWAAKLERALAEGSSLSRKTMIFLDIYRDVRNWKKHLITDYIVHEVWERRGYVKVASLVEKTGYAHCYVDRVFKTQTGMSVKKYAEIVRVQNAIHDLYANDSGSPCMGGIYMDLGYYDQPHFIHDFKMHTTFTPTYIKAHNNVTIV